MAQKITDQPLRDKVVHEIDTIKGPLLAHGCATILMALGVVEKSAHGSLMLSSGKQTYRQKTCDPASEKKIGCFLAMNTLVQNLPTCASLDDYNRSLSEFRNALSEHHVPKLASKAPDHQYNREWVFRSLAIPLARVDGVRRLYYSPSNGILELPGPDASGNLGKIAEAVGGSQTVGELFDRFKVKCAPEFVSLFACLQSGRYANKLGQHAGRQANGPCLACKGANKGAKHCRVVKGHSAAAAPRQRRRQRRKRPVLKR